MSPKESSSAARLEVEPDPGRGVLTLKRRGPRSAGWLLMGSAAFMFSPAAYLVATGKVNPSGWIVGHLILWAALFGGGVYVLIRETTIVVDEAWIRNSGRQGNLQLLPPIPLENVAEAVAERHLIRHGNRAAEHWRVDARLRDGSSALITRCFDEAEARRIAEEIDRWLNRDEREAT